MNKKWSLILILLFMLTPFLAFAEDVGAGVEKSWWFEVQAVSGKNPAKLIGWYEKDSLVGDFGFFGSAVALSDGYRSGYIGPTWVPTEGLALGIAVGREVVRNDVTGVRRAAFVDVTHGNVHAFGIFENGASGMWDKVTATYALTERVGLGVMHEKLLGYGPLVEYNFAGKLKSQAWVAILQGRYPNADDIMTRITTFVVGLNISF